MSCLENASSILLIRPSALGDVCRSVPALVSLRRRFPGARIDWLVQDSFAPAIASHPDLTGVVAFPRRKVALGRLWRAEARQELRQFLGSLRAPRYDLVVDCQGLGRSGLFAMVTRAKERVGFANARELGFLGFNRRVHVPRSMHSVDRMLALLSGVGISVVRDMRLHTSGEDRAAIDQRLVGTRYAVLAPTSRWIGKRWPAERFAALAEALLAEGGVEAVAIVGSGSEREQITPVVQFAERDSRVIDLVGKTGVGSLMATIEGSALVVANDSAALHMAVGFNRPLVGLYGPTQIDLVGPYRRESDVIQAFGPPEGGGNRHKDEELGRKAMEAIGVDRVIVAALERCTQGAPGAASARD